MKQYSFSDLGWAAGVIDGEGCIAITLAAHTQSERKQYAMYLAVGNTDPRMIQRLVDLFGGSVVRKGSLKARTKQMWEWRIFSTKAAEIIRLLRPYLVVKGEQADIALAFAATLKRIGPPGHSAEVIAMREQLRGRIAVLKREEIA